MRVKSVCLVVDCVLSVVCDVVEAVCLYVCRKQRIIVVGDEIEPSSCRRVFVLELRGRVLLLCVKGGRDKLTKLSSSFFCYCVLFAVYIDLNEKAVSCVHNIIVHQRR